MAHKHVNLSFTSALGAARMLTFGFSPRTVFVPSLAIAQSNRTNVAVGLRRNVESGIEATEADMLSQDDVLMMVTLANTAPVAVVPMSGIILATGHALAFSQASSSGTAAARLDLYGEYKTVSLAEWAALVRRTSSET